MRLTVNGEDRSFEASLTVEQLLVRIGLDGRRVAVERNREVVPKSRYGETALGEGDRIEIVHFIGGGAPSRDIGGGSTPTGVDAAADDDDTWTVAGRRFRSRLIIGTGKYKDYETNRLALEASGA